MASSIRYLNFFEERSYRNLVSCRSVVLVSRTLHTGKKKFPSFNFLQNESSTLFVLISSCNLDLFL